ncbi:MAG TPA: major capsid protein [Pseudonocardia sp.]|uniref:major capsid protein n=1 Tax=Pseudonocardia sp. TaxID=60912 RepID=UPI002B5CAEDE|nr:major capsid protein [Pseudonocardia sp.]HTF53587.1 major capsid protein [Pseudonocardia sp.]
MALWTEAVDPATLTGYARESLAAYEARQGRLSLVLPNREVADIVVRFVAGQNGGLVDIAYWRAFDAEPEIGQRDVSQRVTIELPAVGRNEPITEYEQLRGRSGEVTAELALTTIQRATDRTVRAIADAVEYLRGIVIHTGKATIDQYNFKSDDDFGRDVDHSITAPVLWSNTAADRLTQLSTWSQVVTDATGSEPGAILMSTRAFRALANGDQFRTILQGGATRPAVAQDVRDLVIGNGLPPITLYDRRVRVNGVLTKVLPDDSVYLLPAMTEDSDGTDLGATFWGRTLSSTVPGYGIEASEQPGVVVGVYQHDKPPHGLEVIGDAIALPVLANPDLSFVAKVL